MDIGLVVVPVRLFTSTQMFHGLAAAQQQRCQSPIGVL